jgi:FeS assembly SUF system protein
VVEDDGKTLFDFMPGRPAPVDDDPFEKPSEDDRDPALTEAVVEAIRTVRDPEIPVNLIDLGLIYELSVGRDGKVFVEMTLTAPSCPVAGSLPGDVERAIRTVPGVTDAHVRLVWTPPWHKGLMSEEAMLELGLL